MPPQRRETRQRVAVSAALDDVDSFVSAQQLHSRLRNQGDGVGLATVYRTLQQLAEDGEVDVLRTSETESMYRRCCRYCRHTVEVDSLAVERWARRIADDNGFVDVGHVVEVFGTCAECAAAGKGHTPPRNES